MDDTDFQRAVDYLIEVLEGVHDDHPNDHGGETFWGLIKQDWINGVPPKSVKEAKEIYYNRYWTPLQASTSLSPGVAQRHDLPFPIAFTAFDMHVAPIGGAYAKLRIQNLLGGLKVDGILGPKTLARAKAVAVDPKLLGEFFERVIEDRTSNAWRRFKEDATQEGFVLGWMRRIAKAAVFAMKG